MKAKDFVTPAALSRRVRTGCPPEHRGRLLPGAANGHDTRSPAFRLLFPKAPSALGAPDALHQPTGSVLWIACIHHLNTSIHPSKTWYLGRAGDRLFNMRAWETSGRGSNFTVACAQQMATPARSGPGLSRGCSNATGATTVRCGRTRRSNAPRAASFPVPSPPTSPRDGSTSRVSARYGPSRSCSARPWRSGRRNSRTPRAARPGPTDPSSRILQSLCSGPLCPTRADGPTDIIDDSWRPSPPNTDPPFPAGAEAGPSPRFLFIVSYRTQLGMHVAFRIQKTEEGSMGLFNPVACRDWRWGRGSGSSRGSTGGPTAARGRARRLSARRGARSAATTSASSATATTRTRASGRSRRSAASWGYRWRPGRAAGKTRTGLRPIPGPATGGRG